MSSSTDRIEKQIFLKASRARIWRALSNAEEFGDWFGAALKGQTFAPGQEARGQITSCGHEHMVLSIRVERMEPERLLSFYWHPYAVDPKVDYTKEEPTLVVFELVDAEGGILLKVVESGFDKVPAARRAEAFRLHEGGWEAQMNNIAKYVTA